MARSVTAPVEGASGTRGARLHIPEAPAIPGLVFRAYRDASDHPGMVAVWNAVALASGSPRQVTVEGMDSDYESLSNCDPFRDAVIAEIDGEIVAYTRAFWADVSEGGRSYEAFCFVHPKVRRRGIGRALLRHTERRRRRVASRHPSIEPKWLSSVADDSDPGAAALLTSEGYEPVRYFAEMERPTLDDIPDRPIPAGLSLRPVEDAHVRPIWDAIVEAFRDEWGHQDETEEAFVRFKRHPGAERSMWQVAWDGEEVAGVVINEIDEAANQASGKRAGWVEIVAVRRPWRRRGLAGALIARSLATFRQRGMTSALLQVDADNPSGAFGLYQRLGFTPVRRQTAYRKPLDSRLSFDERTRRAFMADGRVTQIPRQRKKQLALLRHVAASAFEVDATYPEREVNGRLAAFHDDVATFRRLLVDHGFMTRAGGVYRLRPRQDWPPVD